MTFDRSRLPDPASYYADQGLTLKGPPRGKWRTARCPLHDGESLRINTETGAFCCMGGCDFRGGDVAAYEMALHGGSFVDVAKRLGAWIEDGKPQRQSHASAMSATDRLSVLAAESDVVFVVASDVHAGRQISETDMARLLVAIERIGKVRWSDGLGE